jgi:hypothetical protein
MEENKELSNKKQCDIHFVSNSKAEEREQAYQKYFYDHPNFRGKSIRYKGNYIFHKDEAYDCIDYYLQTGIEP